MWEGALSVIAFLCSCMKKRTRNCKSISSLPFWSSVSYLGKRWWLVFLLWVQNYPIFCNIYHNQWHLKHFEGSKFLITWLIWLTFLVPIITWKLLQDLEIYFENYFPHWWQFPFQHGYKSHYVDTASADINNQHTEDNTELQESGIQKHTFSTTNLHTFWCHTKSKGIPISLNLP